MLRFTLAFVAQSLVPTSCLLLAACASEGASPAPAPAAQLSECQDDILNFDVTVDNLDNHFYQGCSVSAHLVASSGTTPRLIVAFPAGNTGAGLWFEELSAPASLTADGPVRGVERGDGMRGLSARLRSDAPELTLRKAVLGSVRTLRDYIYSGLTSVAPEVEHEVQAGPPLVLRRTTLDGRHHVETILAPEEGTSVAVEGERIVLTAGPSGEIRVQVIALADDAPLHPFPADKLVTADAADSPRDLQALAFLTYEEKLLAGSWRFLTYFGRDTLLSTRLLMPVLQPEVIEGALGSVLERLAPDGDVAHEEEIGDFAALVNLEKDPPPEDLSAPNYDYKMVDDDFLLAPVLAAYLLDTPAGQERAEAFLARTTPSGERYAGALKRNLDLVMQRAAPFAAAPSATTLVELKEGFLVGDWRDSDKGLGGGRFAFDINVALVPAALHAAARLHQSPLLGDAAAAAEAEGLAAAWAGVESYFRVEVPMDAAQQRVSDYAASVQLDPAEAVASISGPVTYHAISLDESGAQVPVMHSDSGFVLLFTDPSPGYLESVAGQLLRPFPAGLRTAVGVVVANPSLALDPEVQATFTRADYHGAVVWSWQQAMLAAGIRRQRQRADLPAATQQALADAEAALWAAITARNEQRTGELWSWQPEGGAVAYQSFAEASGNVDESNAVQLWSTVYLAVKPPTP